MAIEVQGNPIERLQERREELAPTEAELVMQRAVGAAVGLVEDVVEGARTNTAKVMLAGGLTLGGPAMTVINAAPAAAEVSEDGTHYIVDDGDVVSRIAEEVNKSVADLQAVPGNEALAEDPDTIFPGDRIELVSPVAPARTETITSERLVWHVAEDLVAQDPTLGSVRAVSDALMEHNNISDARRVPNGTVITVPPEFLPQDQDTRVTVQPGDTLSQIATRNGTTLNAILNHPENDEHRDNPRLIHPNDEVVIPAPSGTQQVAVAEPQPVAEQPVAASAPVVEAPAAPPAPEVVVQPASAEVMAAPDHTVEQFMAAIASQESGGDFHIVAASTGAYGAFQIMPSNWPAWSTETFGEVRDRTPENQFAVARHKMLQYYEQFNHRWDAVAIAWFAGPGRAQRFIDGDMSVLRMSDGNATVEYYVEKMESNIGRVEPHTIFPGLVPTPEEQAAAEQNRLAMEYAAAVQAQQEEAARVEAERLAQEEAARVEAERQAQAEEQRQFDANAALAEAAQTKINWDSVRNESNGIQTVEVEGVRVNVDIATKLADMLVHAEIDGINLDIGVGVRTPEDQARMRVVNGCPDIHESPASSCRVPTARPGHSNHQPGLAIDFEVNGEFIHSRNEAAFLWLAEHGGEYGFRNLPSEPWHWSVDGR